MALWTVSALASHPAYPLLANARGLRVYGPPSRPNICPRLLILPPNALSTTRRAVALAMPRFAARLKLNGGDPAVSGQGRLPLGARCNRRWLWAQVVAPERRCLRTPGARPVGQPVTRHLCGGSDRSRLGAVGDDPLSR